MCDILFCLDLIITICSTESPPEPALTIPQDVIFAVCNEENISLDYYYDLSFIRNIRVLAGRNDRWLFPQKSRFHYYFFSPGRVRGVRYMKRLMVFAWEMWH